MGGGNNISSVCSSVMFGKAKTKEVYKFSVYVCHVTVKCLYTYHSMRRLKFSQNIANKIKVTLTFILQAVPYAKSRGLFASLENHMSDM